MRSYFNLKAIFLIYAVKAHAKEPIAYGLNAVVGDFLIEDKEGQMDKLEDSIKSLTGVGEIQVINISRQSITMK